MQTDDIGAGWVHGMPFIDQQTLDGTCSLDMNCLFLCSLESTQFSRDLRYSDKIHF